MVGYLAQNTFTADLASDGKRRSIDPKGKITQPTIESNRTAPVVSIASNPYQIHAKGQTASVVFVSTQAGYWSKAAGPDYMTYSVSADGLTCTATWQTGIGVVGHSRRVGMRCENAGGTSIKYGFFHVGILGIVRIGAGLDYEFLDAAIAGEGAGGKGKTFIIEKTYSDDARDFFRSSGPQAAQPYQPPEGIYTTDSSGADPQYTFTHYTTLCCLEPMSCTLDFNSRQDIDGLGLYGDTQIRSDAIAAGFSNFWNQNAVAGQRGIVIDGFNVIKTWGSGLTVYHCDNVILRYVNLIDPVQDRSTTSNQMAFQIQNSRQCIVEYCSVMGGGRYKFSNFQSTEVVFRRCLGRIDLHTTQEPVGFASQYRARDCSVDNVIAFDCDQVDHYLNTTSAQTANLFGSPATGAQSYPRNVQFRRCGSVKSEMGFAYNFAESVPFETSGFLYQDCWSIDTDLQLGDFVQNGPATFKNCTFAYIEAPDNPGTTSSHFFFCFRNRLDFEDCVLHKAGYDFDTGTSQNQGGYIYSQGNGPQQGEINVDNFLLSEFIGNPLEVFGGSPNWYTKTDFQRDIDAQTNGLDYIFRTESGSELSSRGLGANNGLKVIGLEMSHWGSPELYVETNECWLDLIPQNLIFESWRNYSFADFQGAINSNRGVCLLGESAEGYIMQRQTLGNKTPMPTRFSAQKQSDGFVLGIGRYSQKYVQNLSQYKVVIDGDAIAEVSADTHAIEFDGLLVGHTYEIKIIADDNVTGDSGISELKKVVV